MKTVWIFLLMLLVCGCATTYIPVSWGLGDTVQNLSHSDLMLRTLFDRYDPQRETLRVRGASFDEVMMADEVKFHLGAYRPDTKLIYRNLYNQYTDTELRDLVLHELAHHIWFNAMLPRQCAQWREHLRCNPSPLQTMVRSIYPVPESWESEDFAFTVEYARPVDIVALADLNLITAPERDAILAALAGNKGKQLPNQSILRATAPESGTTPSQMADKNPSEM